MQNGRTCQIWQRGRLVFVGVDPEILTSGSPLSWCSFLPRLRTAGQPRCRAALLAWFSRGTERQVVIFPEIANDHCEACRMQCLDVCPTGVISREFSVHGLAPKGKKPLAYLICIRDDDNAREVAEMVGDREK